MIKSLLPDRKTALFAVISGIWLAYLFMQFNRGSYIPYFEPLQKTASDFFVRCASENCSSLILPLLSYLLIPNQPIVSYLYLWVIVVYAMGVYLIYLIFRYSRSRFHNFLPINILIFTVLLESNIPFHPEYLACTLAVFIGIFGAKCKQKGWECFALAAVLFHPELGSFVLLSLIIINLFANPTKDRRFFILKLIRSLFMGYVIICLYLMLIDYDFLKWAHAMITFEIQQNFINKIFIYLGSLFALLFIYAEQPENQP